MLKSLCNEIWYVFNLNQVLNLGLFSWTQCWCTRMTYSHIVPSSGEVFNYSAFYHQKDQQKTIWYPFTPHLMTLNESTDVDNWIYLTNKIKEPENRRQQKGLESSGHIMVNSTFSFFFFFDHNFIFESLAKMLGDFVFS